MELRDLQWAIAAAQHRSLRQAAEARYIRQSTLSRSVRSVEHQLGAALFERTNGGTRPTINSSIENDQDALVREIRRPAPAPAIARPPMVAKATQSPSSAGDQIRLPS
jgi:Bacterial regulatory helix-turn-helix protein, lysR family